MRFKLYREHGALNSPEIFNAFEQGLTSLGHKIVETDEDVAVIWSVLWQGRMAGNQQVYKKCKETNTPIIIIEVGNLLRGKTWRLSISNINGLGEFGNSEDLDTSRPKKLGIDLQPVQQHRRGEILIAAQHSHSLQWEGMKPMKVWVEETIDQIRQYSKRRIVVRPHPRSLFPLKIPGIIIDQPQRVPNTYDDFNIFYNYHCVINHNSGPAVQAAIRGVPIICDASSLASQLSGTIENIEKITLPDRENWFLKLSHTEWTVEEISNGIPQSRLINKILQNH